MEEFLIKGQNENLRADRGKACCREHNLARLTECVWRLDFFSAPDVLFEGCLCVCITWEDAPRFPKAVEMKLKASPKNAIWVAIEGGPGVETPGWGTEMEVWRRKHGRTRELNRGLWLEMRLESRQGPGHLKPCKHGEILSFILEWYYFTWNGIWWCEMIRCREIVPLCRGVYLLIAYSWPLRPPVGHPGPTVSDSGVGQSLLTPAKTWPVLLGFSLVPHSASHANSSGLWPLCRLWTLIPIGWGSHSKWVHSHSPAGDLAVLGARCCSYHLQPKNGAI